MRFHSSFKDFSRDFLLSLWGNLFVASCHRRGARLGPAGASPLETTARQKTAVSFLACRLSAQIIAVVAVIWSSGRIAGSLFLSFCSLLMLKYVSLVVSVTLMNAFLTNVSCI